MSFNIKNISQELSKEIGFDVTEKLDFVYKNNVLTIRDKSNSDRECFFNYSSSIIDDSDFNSLLKYAEILLGKKQSIN